VILLHLDFCTIWPTSGLDLHGKSHHRKHDVLLSCFRELWPTISTASTSVSELCQLSPRAQRSTLTSNEAQPEVDDLFKKKTRTHRGTRGGRKKNKAARRARKPGRGALLTWENAKSGNERGSIGGFEIG
jgi:hypothetical protein